MAYKKKTPTQTQTKHRDKERKNTDKTQRQREEKHRQKHRDKERKTNLQKCINIYKQYANFPTTIMYNKLPATKINKQTDTDKR